MQSRKKLRELRGKYKSSEWTTYLLFLVALFGTWRWSKWCECVVGTLADILSRFSLRWVHGS
jgi:hypothetical protein